MYICICNEITEEDLKLNPELWKLVGTNCGVCLSDGADTDSTELTKV